MKTVIKKIKKHWILIWLVTVFLIAATLVTYAAYTGLRSVKRVVTTKSTEGDFFSSNCMRTSLSEKKINTAMFDVTVCNYDQNDQYTPNNTNIAYSLTAEIVVMHSGTYKTMTELKNELGASNAEYLGIKALLEGRTYSIAKTEDDSTGAISSPAWELLSSGEDYAHTFSNQMLTGGSSSTDIFTAQFADEELTDTSPDFFIRLTATSNDMGTLSCVLYAIRSTAEAAGWQGSFIENLANNYDFYNYVISGSGKGTLDVLYDPAMLELSPFFLSAASGYNVSAPADYTYNGKAWKKVSLSVDASKLSRYELQIYKTNPGVSYTGTNSPANFIAVAFTPASE